MLSTWILSHQAVALHMPSASSLECLWCCFETWTPEKVSNKSLLKKNYIFIKASAMVPNWSLMVQLTTRFSNAECLGLIGPSWFPESCSFPRLVNLAWALHGVGDSFLSSQPLPWPSISHKVGFWVLRVSTIFYFRSNSETCWNLASIGHFYPWAALCCMFKSWESWGTQVCNQDRWKEKPEYSESCL